MESISSRLIVALAAVALGACGGGTAPAPRAPIAAPALQVAADTGETPAAANPGGKYAHLLTVVHAPEDEATYGALKDYGPWGPGEWAGAMRPKGYWVYVAPSWYVWESEAKSAPAQEDAKSANGKYDGLIKTLDAPEDRATYGDVKDYGAWGPGAWAGAMQPQGYWVYVAPTWYIWRSQK